MADEVFEFEEIDFVSDYDEFLAFGVEKRGFDVVEIGFGDADHGFPDDWF